MRVINIRNFKAVLKAMQGVDAVIHLAANRDYNLFEAARQAGVKQIIYASSVHVSGRQETNGRQITPEQPVHPDSLYAVGKAFGEALGQFYVDQYGISIVCLRIGGFKANPSLHGPNDIMRKNWCSPRDLAQLVQRSLEQKDLGFQIFYAVSDNTCRCYDISNAEILLGYDPQDNAEQSSQLDPKIE